MIEFLIIAWAGGACTCLAGLHGLFRAEHERQRKVDLAVERAWRVIERELNPPAPPSQEDYQRMTAMQQSAFSQAAQYGQQQAHPLQGYYSNQMQNSYGQSQGLLGQAGIFGAQGLFGL